MVNQTGDANAITRLSDREFVMTRVFNASRDLVYQVYTDPKHIPNWWGPREVTTRVDQMDVTPGGKWRYVQVAPDGSEYAFYGEYREVVPPEKLVYTFEFEGMPGHVVQDTLTLAEENGKTTLTATSLFDSAADLDGMLSSGAESGAIASWDRLAEVIESLS